MSSGIGKTFPEIASLPALRISQIFGLVRAERLCQTHAMVTDHQNQPTKRKIKYYETCCLPAYAANLTNLLN
jgi:hypothetical protein